MCLSAAQNSPLLLLEILFPKKHSAQLFQEITGSKMNHSKNPDGQYQLVKFAFSLKTSLITVLLKKSTKQVICHFLQKRPTLACNLPPLRLRSGEVNQLKPLGQGQGMVTPMLRPIKAVLAALCCFILRLPLIYNNEIMTECQFSYMESSMCNKNKPHFFFTNTLIAVPVSGQALDVWRAFSLRGY